MRNIIKFMITNIKKCANYDFHVKSSRNKHYKSQNKCGPGSIIIFGVHISNEYNKANCKATLKSKINMGYVDDVLDLINKKM